MEDEKRKKIGDKKRRKTATKSQEESEYDKLATKTKVAEVRDSKPHKEIESNKQTRKIEARRSKSQEESKYDKIVDRMRKPEARRSKNQQ